MNCDKETLIGYIYDELAGDERARFERHLQRCAECRDEVDGLRATRAHLSQWAPPEVEFAVPRFRIVRDEEAGAAPPVAVRRFHLSPAWGLAAAAVLLLAVASAIANLEIKYGSEGLVIRTGWAKSAPVAATATPAAVPAVSADALKTDVRNFEARLRRLEAAVPAHQPRAADGAPSSRMSDADMLRQVRAIVSQSEERQQHEVALRLTQVLREWDAQRQADLVRVQQGLQRMQGLTDAQLIQHRDALNNLNYMVRVAQQSR